MCELILKAYKLDLKYCCDKNNPLHVQKINELCTLVTLNKHSKIHKTQQNSCRRNRRTRPTVAYSSDEQATKTAKKIVPNSQSSKINAGKVI